MTTVIQTLISAFFFFFFFFNDTATTEIYTLSLHDALPSSSSCLCVATPPRPPDGLSANRSGGLWGNRRSGPPRTWGSDPLEVAGALNIGDARVQLALLGASEVEQVIGHGVAERPADERALLERARGLGQRAGHLGEVRRGIGVARECRPGLDLVLEAVEPRGQERRVDEIGVGVRARDPALHPQRVARAHGAE